MEVLPPFGDQVIKPDKPVHQRQQNQLEVDCAWHVSTSPHPLIESFGLNGQNSSSNLADLQQPPEKDTKPKRYDRNVVCVYPGPSDGRSTRTVPVPDVIDLDE